MKVTDHITKANGKTLFTIEVLPPLKGDNVGTLFDNLDPLMEFKPAFVDVTYHREEYVYKQMPNGLLEKSTTRKRPGTVGICAAIQNRYKVDTVPHLICGGFSKEETENALIDLHFLGIDNILALQGDAIKTEPKFIPEPDGHAYASELIRQIENMNHGVYLDALPGASPTDFCIGVAGYPEKHFAAPNLQTDIKYLKNKVDSGATYIVTQMFFDNKKYFEFVKLCRSSGINVPIIPGIKPVTAKAQCNALPTIFHIDFPEDLIHEIEKCNTNTEVRQAGVEWGIQQCRELIKAGVPTIHFYCMGKSEPVYSIAKHLF